MYLQLRDWSQFLLVDPSFDWSTTNRSYSLASIGSRPIEARGYLSLENITSFSMEENIVNKPALKKKSKAFEKSTNPQWASVLN